jgi:thiol-disulfide isomerase/thioredoxin
MRHCPILRIIFTKSKTSVLLLILFCLPVGVSGHKTSITFRSNVDISVRIKKPIDGAFNSYIISDKLDLKPNISINYELEAHDFCSVKCELSNGYLFYISLQEGDHLEINNSNNKISFRGDNAAGNQYLNDNYCSKGLGFHYPKIASIFKKHITNKIDFEGIDKDLQDSIVSLYSNDLTKLKTEGKITELFAAIMSKNLHHAYSDILLMAYQNILWGEINKYKPSSSDSIIIMNKLDQLYTPNGTNENPLKYCYANSLSDYYMLKYKMLNAQTKDKLTGKYDKDTFNKYIAYLLAPEYIQQILFGENLVYQLQNMETYYNQEKMLKYLTAKFPESEYLPIIKELLLKQNKKPTVNDDTQQPIIIDGKAIHSLKDLGQVEGIKGKRVYIDLWATFCIPCKMQFQYNKDLLNIFNQYDNLVSVYISIDDEKDEPMWKKQIEYFHLYGYNLRASKGLYNDISKKIYDGQACSIPRYILLDTHGNIINSNLPRPQSLDRLKEEFNKKL